MTSRGTKYWNSGAIPLIAPEILGNIISEVADLGIVIAEDGAVLSVLINPHYRAFSKLEKLEGKDIRSALSVESVPKFDERLDAFLKDEGDVRPVELNHADTALNADFPVRYSFHRIGPDGAILLLGRDLRPIAEMQQQLIKAQLALERDFEIQREYDTRFRVLMETTTDAMVFVAVHSGKITEINQVAAELAGKSRDALIGTKFDSFVAARKKGALLELLSNQAISNRETAVPASLQGRGSHVQLFPTLFRASGERFLMCRMAMEDPANTNIDSLSEHLRSLYTAGPDAVVFTADDGRILSANEGFLDLIGVGHDSTARGRAIADYLQRGSVDFKVMTENASRIGRMRSYATKVAGEYGSPRSVDVAITTIEAGKETIFAFVIRDASRAEQVRSGAATGSDESMQSVIELVGSSTLKEIVAETTNVVEKMCIETAVELTMNNRVAAAEMLGLSRQSLYVKLRKFGLLERDSED